MLKNPAIGKELRDSYSRAQAGQMQEMATLTAEAVVESVLIRGKTESLALAPRSRALTLSRSLFVSHTFVASGWGQGFSDGFTDGTYVYMLPGMVVISLARAFVSSRVGRWDMKKDFNRSINCWRHFWTAPGSLRLRFLRQSLGNFSRGFGLGGASLGRSRQ